MPGGSLVALQMPSLTVVGYGSEGIVIEPPVEQIEMNPGAGSVLGNFREEEEIFEEGREWKGRSYRELKETLEILTMIGFFD